MNKKEFVVILTITFIVFMIWIITDIILAKPSVSRDPRLNSLLGPVDPIFDKSVIEEIKKMDSLPISTDSAEKK